MVFGERHRWASVTRRPRAEPDWTPEPLETHLIARYRAPMRKSVFTALAALCFLSAGPATAHPHVWVTGAASFKFEESKLTRIGMRWQFDAFFSQVLGADFDTNADGTFDADETQAMKDQVFTSLRDYSYFTHLRTKASAMDQTFAGVDNFVISDDRGEMVFSFDLILANPVDPATEAIGMSLYDPTIYVDLILGGDKPVDLTGADNLGCALEYGQGDEINSESYFVTPQVVWLSCAAS